MILVTGCPRSGTTPLGYMFEKFMDYSVLHEPFNYHTGLEQVGSYFQYRDIDQTVNGELKSLLIRIANNDVIMKDGIFPGENIYRRFAKRALGGRTKRSYKNFTGNKRVIKDPFLALSLKSSSEVFDHMFITIRPPVGIINSFRKYKWVFPEVFPYEGFEYFEGYKSSEFLNQPEFYALYIQYLIYISIEKLETNSFTVIDTSKLADKSSIQLAELFGFLKLESYEKLYQNLKNMYESNSKGLFSGIHNHQRGKNALKASYDNVNIPENCMALYMEVCRLYECQAN
ncbi:hypothetical protein Q4508_14095 [Amphritea sp. 2_MG-2023]|uniref:hypothetical protein n=1 Tax=Amphritea TaxID=515417 RepID=UPI001C0661FE|nr:MULTISPECIES: hypothetical protein [Amphritea]MBU2964354.1 hypothetical protein [Amphritea atlantica]MDO6419686.1 hypothetical protein [Amphritea sp. 2_MG-2023]